jgi:hypothetical protein
MKGGNVTQQIGQELPILVKHADNTGLTNGKVVYQVSSDGTNITVRYASASIENASSKTFGVMTEDASGGAKAFCTTFGLVRDINTSALTEGSIIWLSETAGEMTTTRPTQPAHGVIVGRCIRQHATQGVIFVSVQNGFEIEELHDVLITSKANNDGLFYESSTGLWKNKTIANILGYTPANGADYLPLVGGTLTGGLYINPNNASTVGLDVASDTIRFRSDNVEGFKRQLTTTMGSGTLVKMQAAGYGGTYVTDLGFYTSSNSAVNTTPNIYLTGGDNRVGINTTTPAYTLDVAGTIGASGAITANSFVKASGTSLQFLMADGSVSLGATATARTEQIFTATSGQTTFTVTGGYVVGLVDVYVNGVKLLPSDFTATNGSTVVLATGAVLNDSVTIINYTATIAALPTSRDTIDYTATSAQTTFTVSGGYVVGLLDVYVNGVKLTSSEYTATNGTTFVLTVASVTGDQVQAIRYNASITGVSGSGTANYIPKFAASQTLGNSLIQDDGTTVTIGSTNSALMMPRAATSNDATINFSTGGTNRWQIGTKGVYGAEDLYIWNVASGYAPITFSAASSLANFGVSIRAITFTSYTASGIFLNNSSGGTSSVHMRLNNTGGDLRMGIESSTGGGFQTGTSAYAAVFGNQANYSTQFTTNGIVRLTIDATGNAGIGTVSPSFYTHGGTNKLLEILNSGTSANSQSHLILSTGAAASAGSIGTITWAIPNSSGGEKRAVIIGAGIESDSSSLVSGFLQIYTTSGGSISEKLRMDSLGRVGIGTSALSATGANLQVQQSGTPNIVAIRRGDNSNTGSARVLFQAYNASAVLQNTGIVEAGLDNSSTLGYLALSAGTPSTPHLKIYNDGRTAITMNQSSNNQFLNFVGTQTSYNQEWGFGIVNNSRDFRLYDYTSGNERLRVTENGYIDTKGNPIYAYSGAFSMGASYQTIFTSVSNSVYLISVNTNPSSGDGTFGLLIAFNEGDKSCGTIYGNNVAIQFSGNDVQIKSTNGATYSVSWSATRLK